MSSSSLNIYRYLSIFRVNYNAHPVNSCKEDQLRVGSEVNWGVGEKRMTKLAIKELGLGPQIVGLGPGPRMYANQD